VVLRSTPVRPVDAVLSLGRRAVSDPGRLALRDGVHGSSLAGNNAIGG